MTPQAIKEKGITITQAGQYVEYPTGAWTNGIKSDMKMTVNLQNQNTTGLTKYILDT